MRRFTKSLYFRLFLLAFGMEIVMGILAMLWPAEVRSHSSVARPPALQVFGVATGILVLVTILIGGVLLVYNPQLNRYPDPPMTLNLDGSDACETDSGGNSRQDAEWPNWKPVAGCIAVLAAGLLIFALLNG